MYRSQTPTIQHTIVLERIVEGHLVSKEFLIKLPMNVKPADRPGKDNVRAIASREREEKERER